MSLGFTLAAPVTAAQAGPALLGGCESLIKWSAPLESVHPASVDEFLTELRSQDIVATARDLVAYQVPTADGMTTVMTGAGAPVALCPAVANGVETSQVAALPSAVPVPKPAANTMATSKLAWSSMGEDGGGADSPYWLDVSNDDPKDCMWIETDRYKRYVCWDILFQVNDYDGNNHHWQFYASASGAKVGSGTMTRIWVEGKPNYPVSDYQNFDGRIPKPEADYTAGEDCVSKTETITISTGNPVQIGEEKSVSRTLCERYGIKMYEDEGHWAHIWYNRKDDDGTAGTRNVAFNMGVRTPQDSEQDNRVSWFVYTGQHVERCC